MDISRPCQPEKLIPLLPWPGFDPSFSGHNDRRAITSEWTRLRLKPLSHRGWRLVNMSSPVVCVHLTHSPLFIYVTSCWWSSMAKIGNIHRSFDVDFLWPTNIIAKIGVSGSTGVDRIIPQFTSRVYGWNWLGPPLWEYFHRVARIILVWLFRVPDGCPFCHRSKSTGGGIKMAASISTVEAAILTVHK